MDTIAERCLELRSGNQTVPVVVKLARPEHDVGRDSWKCEYEIHFGDVAIQGAMHGGDALQALQLSMATLDVEIQHETRKRGGVLWHLDEPFTSVLEDSGLQIRPPRG